MSSNQLAVSKSPAAELTTANRKLPSSESTASWKQLPALSALSVQMPIQQEDTLLASAGQAGSTEAAGNRPTGVCKRRTGWSFLAESHQTLTHAGLSKTGERTRMRREANRSLSH